MEPTALETLLTNVGSLITSSVSWMGTFVGSIIQPGNELLLLFVLVPFVGLGIGLLGRIKHA